MAVVNQSIRVRRYFSRSIADRRALPVRTVGARAAARLRIIGIVKDAKYANLREEFEPTAYLAASPGRAAGALVVPDRQAGELDDRADCRR